MPIEALNDTAVHWRPRLMDELESPKVPFPPVEAYVEETVVQDFSDASTAFLIVRESLEDHLSSLLSEIRLLRLPASQEDVRRLVQIRAVVLGALGSLQG